MPGETTGDTYGYRTHRDAAGRGGPIVSLGNNDWINGFKVSY